MRRLCDQYSTLIMCEKDVSLHYNCWSLSLCYIICVGGATLIFSVELLELGKKSYFSIPTDREFWLYAGLLVLVVLGGYELYRKAANKQATTHSTNRKSKKKNK